MNSFSHVDKSGKANMVDISEKETQIRLAIAEGFIDLQSKTIELIGKNMMKKGDVLSVAEIAGIQAAKQTSNLIPLCHPILLNKIKVNTSVKKSSIHVKAEVKSIGKTGVEMETLTAVNIALLTIYDMCKAIDKNMVIRDIKLIKKTKVNIEK